MIPAIDRDRCTGCGNCREVCPPGAILIKDEIAQIEEEFCEECGFCAPTCPAGAITINFPTLYNKNT
jgi:Fe-S-cluster-containing hydrogenase component 2